METDYTVRVIAPQSQDALMRLREVAASRVRLEQTPCDNVRRVATNVQRAMRISRILEEARESDHMR